MQLACGTRKLAESELSASRICRRPEPAEPAGNQEISPPFLGSIRYESGWENCRLNYSSFISSLIETFFSDRTGWREIVATLSTALLGDRCGLHAFMVQAKVSLWTAAGGLAAIGSTHDVVAARSFVCFRHAQRIPISPAPDAPP